MIIIGLCYKISLLNVYIEETSIQSRSMHVGSFLHLTSSKSHSIFKHHSCSSAFQNYIFIVRRTLNNFSCQTRRNYQLVKKPTIQNNQAHQCAREADKRASSSSTPGLFTVSFKRALRLNQIKWDVYIDIMTDRKTYVSSRKEKKGIDPLSVYGNYHALPVL